MNNYFGVIGRSGSALEQELSTKIDFDLLSFRYHLDGRFMNEAFIINNENYIFYFDGFLFDIGSFPDSKSYFQSKLNLQSIQSLVADLNGVYSGAFIDKRSRKTVLFTDHLATRKVFYGKSGDAVFFGSKLKFVTDELRERNSLTVDESAVYGFLGFGFFLSDTSYFMEIKTLLPGELVEIDHCTKELNRKRFFQFEIKKRKWDESALLAEIERLFSRSVRRLTDLNHQYGYKTAAALSAGLDSKTVVVSMYDQGVRDALTVTFAQSGSLDCSVPQTVANDLSYEHLYGSLDGGDYLNRYCREYIRVNEGLLSYQTAVHGYSVLSRINWKNVGIYLSGQVGDVVFGSFIGKKFENINDMKFLSYCGLAQHDVYDRISILQKLFDEYKSRGWELFNYEQRQSNGTICGDIFVRNMVETVSPFFDRELIALTLSVDDEDLIGSKLYIKWLKRYHPNVLRYVWDKCGSKPTSFRKVKFTTQVKRVTGFFRRKLGLSNGMNPFDKWISENPRIISNLKNEFDSGLNAVDISDSLRSEIYKLYHADSDRNSFNKFVTVTCLLGLSLHQRGDFFKCLEQDAIISNKCG